MSIKENFLLHVATKNIPMLVKCMYHVQKITVQGENSVEIF